jgi:hypothetical protein
MSTQILSKTCPWIPCSRTFRHDLPRPLTNNSIIHVVGVNPERRLGLDTIIGNSVSSRTREYVFKCDIAHLLLGDLAFGEIEDQALQLLSDLVAAHDGGEVGPPLQHKLTSTQYGEEILT